MPLSLQPKAFDPLQSPSHLKASNHFARETLTEAKPKPVTLDNKNPLNALIPISQESFKTMMESYSLMIPLALQALQNWFAPEKQWPLRPLTLSGVITGDNISELKEKLLVQAELIEKHVGSSDPEKLAAHPLRIQINSPGGDVGASLSLINTMKELREKRHLTLETHASILCASGAVLIAVNGSKGHRFVEPDTRVVIHEPRTYGGGGQTPSFLHDSKDQTELLERSMKRTNEELERNSYGKLTVKDIEERSKFGKDWNVFDLKAELVEKFGLFDAVETCNWTGFIKPKKADLPVLSFFNGN